MKTSFSAYVQEFVYVPVRKAANFSSFEKKKNFMGTCLCFSQDVVVRRNVRKCTNCVPDAIRNGVSSIFFECFGIFRSGSACF